MTEPFHFHSFESSIPTPFASPERCFVYVRLSQDSGSDFILFDGDFEAGSAKPYFEEYSGTWLLEYPLGTQGSVNWTLRVADDDLPLNSTLQWISLRDVLKRIDEQAATPLVRATQLARWQRDHRFCGRCGTSTDVDSGDGAKVCRACKMRYYPRIAPCMITLVTKGNQLLLAHHARSNRPMYSPLAGFVEAGESAEACVRREVLEEVGIEVKEPLYRGSQFWPFPHQLMLAYWAEYKSGEVVVDPREIIHADWFDYRNLPDTPSTTSIAGRLIADFVAFRQAINRN